MVAECAFYNKNFNITSYKINQYCFKSCVFRKIVLSEGVTEIGYYAFNDASFNEIVMPQSLKTVGDNVFWGASGYTKLHFPDGVETIGENVVVNYTGCTEITFGKNLKSIGTFAFHYYSQDKDIVLPKSLEFLGSYAFSDINYVRMEETNDTYTSKGKNGEECNAIFNIKTNTLVLATNNIDFDNIPDTITTIGDYAFRDCDGFEVITIPENIKVLKQQVFRDCANLKCVIFHENMTSVGSYLFGYSTLTNLIGVIVPKNFTPVRNLNNLQKAVYYLGSKDVWNNLTDSDKVTISTYYYNNGCVHEDGVYWRYDENNLPSIISTMGEYTVDVEPTCSSEGSMHSTCSNCNEVITYEIPKLLHNVVDGVCTMCGETSEYIVTQDETYPFVLDKGVYTNTNQSVYNVLSSMTITAISDITITFSYKVSSYETWNIFTLTKNGTQLFSKAGNISYTEYSITLSAGDILEFGYIKRINASVGDETVYIKDLTITKVA